MDDTNAYIVAMCESNIHISAAMVDTPPSIPVGLQWILEIPSRIQKFQFNSSSSDWSPVDSSGFQWTPADSDIINWNFRDVFI